MEAEVVDRRVVTPVDEMDPEVLSEDMNEAPWTISSSQHVTLWCVRKRAHLAGYAQAD